MPVVNTNLQSQMVNDSDYGEIQDQSAVFGKFNFAGLLGLGAGYQIGYFKVIMTARLEGDPLFVLAKA